jgi:exodeoxyribonuclease-3
MKIISCNVNGIRAAAKKGLAEFIAAEQPNILCLQEIKANKTDFPAALVEIDGYELYVNSASKKGYSGVAIYTKSKPIAVNNRLDVDKFDSEGRMLELDYDNFVILCLYLPHGGRQKENLEYKLEVYKKLFEKLDSMNNKNVILIGDFNIAHLEIDLARPRQNMKNIMFTPEERAQIDKIINLGFVDSFRKFSDAPGNYTWWPYAFDAKQRNMGWRIDYGFVSKKMAGDLIGAKIYPECNFSDHCPIELELVK